MMLDHFPHYTAFSPLIPVYRITDGTSPVIHRFFDTNPISPSGRYIALTRFPYEDRLPSPGDEASVIVIDLETGSRVYESATAAWGTQVGAQVQWGATDTELFFNRMDLSNWRPYGVKVDFRHDDEMALENSLYMVSHDGRLSISPDLVKITIAQSGYGVCVPNNRIVPNVGAPEDDGIFITDNRTGQSRLLVSLRELSSHIAVKTGQFAADAGAFYSFHTKFSSDSSRIMFIMRWFPKGGRSGRSLNYLITLKADGSDVRIAVPPYIWGDGHHPNWYPDGKDIVMNLPSATGLTGRLLTLAAKMRRRFRLPIGPRGVPLHFKRFRFDGSGLESLSQHIGSGHPTIHPKGKHLLTDAYLNEAVAYGDGTVPLRMLDLATREIATVVRIDTLPQSVNLRSDYRIDPHPVWDKAGRFLTFNGAIGGTRGVFIADFATYFANTSDLAT